MAPKMLTTHRLARPATPQAKSWKPILSHAQPDPQAAKGDVARLYPRGIARPKGITRIMTRSLARPSDKMAPQGPSPIQERAIATAIMAAEGTALRAESPAQVAAHPKAGPGRPKKTQREDAK
jgi:hypothetical protein